MSIELMITVKDDDRTLKKEYLVYEPFLMHENDETLKKYIDDATKEFVGDPQDIKVRALMVMR
jgi:hypothetical protein